ncbi:acyltransferase [Priestia megaterium]|uniref:acyltransferase family protein n=1 Tax=Priestia megaterium TaxID=1404 RepID=UPI002076AF3A|nr:acyltransferase [Priestia megaterium]USD17445.1 acyltransferase [Priestia megaterium]USD18536.1 acyltransferase [Priestia megaterium]WRQ93696.1 acyltransferase [Priestia megaterium]
MEKRYVELDALRGLAALFVVINHYLMIYPSFSEYRYDGDSSFLLSMVKESPLRLLFSSGNESVVLFFVLSGFVLALPFYGRSSFRYENYLVRRICRIYLPYLFAVCVAILCKILFSQGGISQVSHWFNNSWITNESPSLLLQHFFLIGTFNTDAYNNVIWSLVHEMRISIIFPLLMILLLRMDAKKIVMLLFVVFVSSSALLLLNQSSLEPTNFLLSYHYLLLFAAGAVTAKYRDFFIQLYLKIGTFKKGLIVLIAFTCYLSEGIMGNYAITNNFLCRNLAVMLGSCMFIIIALASPAASKVLRTGVLSFLGKISYSLYLTHLIVLFSLMYLLHGLLPYWSILSICFLVSLVMASVTYHFVEKPSSRLGKFLTRNKVVFGGAVSRK